MGIYYTYDSDGTPVPTSDVIAWAEFIRTHDEKIAYTELPEVGLRVSTVFMGIDYAYQVGDPPLVFVTMIFPMNSYRDKYCDRYSTKAEALAGHEKAIGIAKSGEGMY